MDYFLDAITGAFSLILTLDPEVVTITLLSLRIAVSATIIAAILGIPLAYIIATREFKGKGILLTLFNTLMALPLPEGSSGLSGSPFYSLRHYPR